MPLLTQLGIAWIIGIAAALWFNISWQLIALATLPAIAALFLYRHVPQGQTLAIWTLAFLAGAFRFAFFQPTIDQDHVAFYNDNPNLITLTGLVVDEPDIRDYYINLKLQAETLRQGNDTRPIEGLVLVRAPRYPERAYGDRLAVTGKLETPPVFEDFSYKDGVSAIDNAPFWGVTYSTLSALL